MIKEVDTKKMMCLIDKHNMKRFTVEDMFNLTWKNVPPGPTRRSLWMVLMVLELGEDSDEDTGAKDFTNCQVESVSHHEQPIQHGNDHCSYRSTKLLPYPKIDGG